MDSLVADAMKSSLTPAFDAARFEAAKVKIAVVGVGGAGTNCVSRLAKMGLQSAETIAVNTDANHLKMVDAGKRLLIGSTLTRGLGAGGFPEIGEKSAIASKARLREILEGTELVFITAGMGGGTGTGAAPVIAEVAKSVGAITVAMVTYPFSLERARLEKADWGLERLQETCDTVVLLDNNRLVSYVPNLPMNQAFAVADTVVAKAVKGIADTVTLPSLMNIDFADLRMIMGNAGTSMISMGEAQGSNRVKDAIESTLAHPLLEVDYTGSKGALILINGGPQLTLGDAVAVGEGISSSFADNAYVKWGARIDPALGDKIQVTAIVTGVTSPHVMGKTEYKNQQMKRETKNSIGIEAMMF